ncbi:MAG TPA: ABC transporter permease [Chitinophagaceae bacterium]|nr:ABC transporter permease [Chitinophagaceae bacterium]
MSKILIIFQKEYLTRIRNKTFLISTFLLPLIIALFIAGIIYFATHNSEKTKVAVNDISGDFLNNLQDDSSGVTFDFNQNINADNFSKEGYKAVLIIPKYDSARKDTIRLISEKELDLGTQEYIKTQLGMALQKKLFRQKNFDKNAVDSILQTSITDKYDFDAYKQKEGKIQQSNFWVAYGIGFTSGMIIYITMMIYGMMVMRGVMEEKTNRIAEVMVSSVKPFQMMMGKITGIAAVGLTQFLMWIVLLIILSSAATAFLPHDTLQHIQSASQNMQSSAAAQSAGTASKVSTFLHAFAGTKWILIVFCFLFYFIGGYLFYASLFAAVGSVVNEDAQEAQSLSLPITMPIILSFVIMTTSIYAPSGSLSVWASIIPFSSPIIMMSRIPFGVPGTVPWWQLGLSMALLIAGFLFTAWIAAKIYRTGILLYGKKVTLKEMGKWLFRKS